jgi:hypothetical protein
MVDLPERVSNRKVKSPPQPKPPFERFLESLKQATATPPKLGLREVRRLLKVGFAESEDPHSIAKAADVMEAYIAADRWAVSVASTEGARLLRTVQQRLLEELRGRFARKIGMFDLDLDGPNIKQEMGAWVSRSASVRKVKEQAGETTKQNTASEGGNDAAAVGLTYHSRLRWALVWLLSKASAERRAEAILALIENWVEGERKGPPERNALRRWNRFIAGVLSAEKPKSSRVSPLLNGLSSLRAELASSLERELVRSRELARTREEFEALRQRADVIQSDLVAAQESLEHSKATVAELEQQLADAEERYKSLDEHWKRSASTELARKVGSLSEEVGHEVQEAILSLDRESPNVPMALSRLRRLDGIVKRETKGDHKEE